MQRHPWRPAFLIVLILALSGADARVSAAATPLEPEPIPLDEYWDLVEHTRQIAAGLQATAPENIEAKLDVLIAQWEAVQQVELEDGQVISIDNGYLLQVLRDADLSRIKALAETLLEAHRKYPAGLFTAADLESLSTILAGPEFQWKEERPNPIIEWINELLEKIARWLDEQSGNGEETVVTVEVPRFPLIPTLMTVALTLVILYIFRSLFFDLVAEARVKGDGDGTDEVLTAEAAFSRAQTLSRGGDYRSAVRFLYLSALLLLNERGLLHYDRSKTNREYLRSVSHSPELAEPLNDVIEVFDNAWYGYHTVDEDSFKHYSERVEELKEKKGS
ncbi:MAG: DUF4129 domain-containing protein [Chloroflexota bacterium]